MLFSESGHPRITLHDHLDGSRPLLRVLPQLFEISKKKWPFNSEEPLFDQVKRLFKDPQIDIVQKFANTTGVMQTRETLSLAAEAYVLGRAQEGYYYCEAIIAPQYHTFGGLSVPEVLDALVEGIKRGEKQHPRIEVNLLASVGREVSSKEAVELVYQFAESDRKYVPGVNLVCDEAAHPPEKHLDMFEVAKERGFMTSCHAGEWVKVPHDFKRDRKKLLRNIGMAVYALRADRVGHATALAFSQDLVCHIAENNIGVEGCPGSNLDSGLIRDVGELKIRDLLQREVLYSLNQDDDLFMPTLEEVVALCDESYAFTSVEKDRMALNAWKTRFGRRKYNGVPDDVLWGF